MPSGYVRGGRVVLCANLGKTRVDLLTRLGPLPTFALMGRPLSVSAKGSPASPGDSFGEADSLADRVRDHLKRMIEPLAERLQTEVLLLLVPRCAEEPDWVTDRWRASRPSEASICGPLFVDALERGLVIRDWHVERLKPRRGSGSIFSLLQRIEYVEAVRIEREICEEAVALERESRAPDLGERDTLIWRKASRRRLPKVAFARLIRGRGPIKTRLLALQRTGFLTRPRRFRALDPEAGRSDLVPPQSIHPIGVPELSVA